MSADYFLKQNDTKADLTATLKDADGVVVNLTGATVRFNMKGVGRASAKVDNASVTVVSASAGTVKYVWSASDTDTPGDYIGEFEVTFGDLTILTFPNGSYGFTILISPEVA